jgi:hypothetical protein
MAGLTLNPGERDIFRVVQVVRQLIEGRSNATGVVTLATGVTSTTVAAATAAPGATVHLTPATAHAAAAYATTYVQQTDVTAGQFVITHDNSAQTDRTFYYEIRG